jgi:hypothetical protein
MGTAGLMLWCSAWAVFSLGFLVHDPTPASAMIDQPAVIKDPLTKTLAHTWRRPEDDEMGATQKHWRFSCHILLQGSSGVAGKEVVVSLGCRGSTMR